MILLSRISFLQKGDITNKKQLEELARFRRHFFVSASEISNFYFTRWPWKIVVLRWVPEGLQAVPAKACHHLLASPLILRRWFLSYQFNLFQLGYGQKVKTNATWRRINLALHFMVAECVVRGH